MEIYRRAHIALVPLLLFVALTVLLAACGAVPATPGATALLPSASLASVSNNTTKSMALMAVQSTAPLTGIRMLDNQNGWALTAHAILKTTDGGVQWKNVTPANAGLNAFARGDFFNMQYAWIAIPPAQMQGNSTGVLRTTNGGRNWQHITITDPLSATVDVPHFLNTQQGWLEISGLGAAGHSLFDIWHSVNGGLSWTKLASSGSASGLSLGYTTGISFQNAQSGIAAGNLGAAATHPAVPVIAVTHNGGKHWQIVSLPLPQGGAPAIISNTTPPVFFGNVVILPVNVAAQASQSQLILYRSSELLKAEKPWPCNKNCLSKLL